MTDFICKTSHKEWRKEAKKFRRKKIRQKLAELRKTQEKLRENSPTFKLEVEKKRLYEEYLTEKEEKEREERNLKWLEEEVKAQKRWREEQKLKQLAEEERLKEIERIKKEWEIEQAKIRAEKEKLEALKKEEEKRRQDLLDKINEFMCNGGDIPSELLVVTESNPGKENCSFYQKVGACRFGGQCSRNHRYYKISNVLMVLNFYSHFNLNQNKLSEYDTDINLEYEETDMYSHFKDFYNDIVPEFKRFGKVIMVKVCCNKESHLRGNVYVEYKNEREALIAYKAFQGRWYGGKQLNIEFVKIRDWGSAICGDFARKRCPKGTSCNFLHVFKNPKNEFPVKWNKNKNSSTVDYHFDDENERSYRRSKSWRWSETPELSPNRRRISSSTKKRVNGRRKSLLRKKKSSLSEKRDGSDSSVKSYKSSNSEDKKGSDSSEKSYKSSNLEGKNESDSSVRRRRLGSLERRKRLQTLERRKRLGSSERRKRLGSSERRKRSDSLERRKRSDSSERRKRSRSSERNDKKRSSSADVELLTISKRRKLNFMSEEMKHPF